MLKDEATLIDEFIDLFKCDTARITSPCERHFLIIGWNRNTKDTGRKWFKNGVPTDFDYVEERVVASGNTEEELIDSAKEYLRISDMTMLRYLKEKIGKEKVENYEQQLKDFVSDRQ